MKQFIFGILILGLFLILLSQFAQAEWMPCEQVGLEKAQASNDYGHCQKILSKSMCCTWMEGNYNNLDMETYIVQVDDLDRPIYDKVNIQSCATPEECAELIEPKCDPILNEDAEGTDSCIYYCDDYEDYYARVDELEAFCIKQVGYEQKDEVRARVNPVKRAARLAREQSEENERLEKDNKKKEAIKELKKDASPLAKWLLDIFQWE